MNEITKDLIKWSQDNKIIINCNKPKEIILGNAKSDNMPHLQIDAKQIERVSEFKVGYLNCSSQTLCAGTIISNLYVRKYHPNYNYFLKLLKRPGLSTDVCSPSITQKFDSSQSTHALSGTTTPPPH